MGVDKSQPGIKALLSKRGVPTRVAVVQPGGVALEQPSTCSGRPSWKSSWADITSGGAGAVPQPLVFKTKPSPEAQSKPQDVANLETEETHAHPISHPEEYTHAIARIGLVADRVGPKKPKTGKNQQPGPASVCLLGVVSPGRKRRAIPSL